MTNIHGLTTEKRLLAAGIDTKTPRFAWKYTSDETGITQKSYRITVVCACGKTVWDSGVVASPSMNVRYAGSTLKPATDYTWTVTAELSNGEVLTASATFFTSLLDSTLLGTSKWISFPHTDNYTREMLPAFRREITISKEIKKAKMYTAGCGIYVARINGERLYNRNEAGETLVYELTPGFTEVMKRKLYHSYDVTHMLQSGVNCLSAIVGRGWWSDQIVRFKGNFSAFRAVLLITYTDGTRETVVTDESWKVSHDHPLRLASVYEGEDYDARYSMAFTKAGFDDSAWIPAEESHDFTGLLTAHKGEPIVCRKDLTLSPAKIYTYCGAKNAAEGEAGVIDNVTEYASADFVLKAGETAVVDFGQNAAGRECFTVSGKAGTTVTIRHGEMLNDGNGKRSRGCDGPEGSVYIENMRSARTTTNYTIGQDNAAETYRPLHTFYGYRYLSITADADVHFTAFTSEVITNIGYDSGKVSCGDEWVNKLISNGRWGMYSNYLSVPTDCPQRDERLGWTADTQVFTTTAQYYSTAAQSFHEKWTQDLADTQHENGAYTSVAPLGPYGDDTGALGWADAGILTPYYVWRMSGDTTIVKNCYGSMKKYMDIFMAERGTAGSLPRYGDWLSFEPNDMPMQTFLGSCYAAWDADLMAEMAAAIGKDEDANAYRARADKQKQYLRDTYVAADGSLILERQCAELFALKLGFLPNDASVEKVKAQFAANVARNGNRLQTGFLGTSILLPTLSQFGMHDLAYTLLLQDQLPSWLYSVKAGATTIWERWNSYALDKGFGDVGMNSFNHYAYGCVAEWLFATMVGIQPDGIGFGKFLLAPVPDKRVGHAEGEYDSVCGTIRSAWHYEGDKVIYECTVPANTSATLKNPITGEVTELVSGTYTFTW